MTYHKLLLFILINIWNPNQILSQSEYHSTTWINSFQERHPNFSKVNITVDGECQLENFFISRKSYKEHYGTIYKDSSCNIYASSGKFEIGVPIDSIPNLYFQQELQLADSSQINFDFPFQKLKKEFDLTTLLLDQNLKHDTLLWVQTGQTHWYAVVDTLKIYSRNDSLKIDWTSIQTGYKAKTRRATKELSKAQLTILKNIENWSSNPRDQALAKKLRTNCRDFYSFHVIRYRNVVKGYFEDDCKKDYWRELREEVLK